MKKGFKAKKQKNIFKLFIIITFLSAALFTSLHLSIKKISINLDNEQIIKYILNTEEESLELDKITNSSFVFEYALGMQLNTKEPVTEPVINYEEEKEVIPNIYIYNTHDTEKYTYESFEAFNINPTVVTASYILKEYLLSYDLYADVEIEETSSVLYESKWKYSDSYKASRILLEEAFIENPTFNYFIDLHRDSSSYEQTTTTINNSSCVRFMFVVGKEHSSYDKNLSLAVQINNELLKIDPLLSRGIIEKEGTGVNGIYNQDFHPGVVLIEVGGQYNSIEEVNCGLVYLAEALKEVLED